MSLGPRFPRPTSPGYDATAFQMIIDEISVESVEAGWKLADARSVFAELIFNLSYGDVVIGGNTAEEAFDLPDDTTGIRGNSDVYPLVQASSYLTDLARASDEMSHWFSFTLDGIAYDSQTDVSAQDAIVNAVDFSADGTFMMMVGQGGDALYGYTVGTAGDMTDVSYSGNSHAVSNANPNCGRIRPDGLMAWYGQAQTIYEVTFGTAFDMSDGTEDGTSLVPHAGSNVTDFAFANDGAYLFTLHADNKIRRRPLNTAYDIDDAGAVDQTYTTGGTYTGMDISTNGMRIVLTTSSQFYQVDLAAPFDMTDAPAPGNAESTGASNANNACLREEIGYVFIADDGNENIRSYAIETELV